MLHFCRRGQISVAARDAKADSFKEPNSGSRTCQIPSCHGTKPRSTFTGDVVEDLQLGLAGFYQLIFRSTVSLDSWH